MINKGSLSVLKYVLILFLWPLGSQGQVLQLPAQSKPLQLRFKQQQQEQRSAYYNISQATVQQEKIYRIEPGMILTGLSVEYPQGASLATSYLVLDNDTLWLKAEAHSHGDEDSHRNRTALYISKAPVKSFFLYSGALQGEVRFHFIYAPPVPGTSPDTSSAGKRSTESLSAAVPSNGNSCDKPLTVPQTGPGGWREGLPAPKEAPLFSEKVRHLFIHHEAGANYVDTLPATTYTNTIRTIYLYHTQSNGWNDIGYNYLIAQNGTIYSGRDAQGSQFNTEDNVVGAHVGGKNTNTMGVCMLGNFVELYPGARQQNALENLLAWKTLKEELDPLASAMHPLGSTNALLTGTIAGHRDGGATSCPGDKQYSLLPEYRLRVAYAMAACTNGIERARQVISQNQSTVTDTFRVGLQYILTAEASSGLVVIHRVAPGSTAPAFVSGESLFISGAGTVLLEASQPGNEAWLYAEPVSRIYHIRKAAQQITNFGGEVRLDYEPGLTIPLQAQGGPSGQPVVYELVAGAELASLAGGALQVHRPGVIIVRALQVGDANYEAALPIMQTFVIEAESVERPLVLYPNPSDGVFYMQAEDTALLSGAQLYNIQGKRVPFRFSAVGYHTYLFQAQNLAQGIYILRFYYAGQQHARKLVIF
jgi:hypothetical protein